MNKCSGLALVQRFLTGLASLPFGTVTCSPVLLCCKYVIGSPILILLGVAGKYCFKSLRDIYVDVCLACMYVHASAYVYTAPLEARRCAGSPDTEMFMYTSVLPECTSVHPHMFAQCPWRQKRALSLLLLESQVV